MGEQSLERLLERPLSGYFSSPCVKVPGIDLWVHPDPRLSHAIFMSLFSMLLVLLFSGPDDLCGLTSADSKNAESAI